MRTALLRKARSAEEETFEKGISKLKGSGGERDHKRPKKADVEVSTKCDFLLLLAMTA